MATEILIVDDNADIRNILNELILDAGYKTRVAANYNQALSEIDKKMPDVAILDVKLDKGDNDGIELLSHIKSINKDVPVIVITGHANIEMAVNSLKKGAFEFVEKPFDRNRLLNFISRAVENLNLKNQNKEFENKLFSSYDLIGESKNILTIRDQIDKISLTESRILINGPSGSGKELVARKIHKDAEYYASPGLWPMRSPFLTSFKPIEIKNFSVKTNQKSFDFFPYVSGTNNFIENNRSINFGGEIFWDIDSQSKLDVSVNPDFGQVESDDVIVNFSANETFYPDKRPFFTENQSLFEVIGQDLRFINTRRIGAIPDKCSDTDESHQGQCKDYRYDSTDINAAVRYTKKGKINQYGLFTSLEDNSLFSQGRDFFAGRFKKNLDSTKGTIGYLVTYVDRPSINRKSFINVADFDYRPSDSSRLYGWVSQANIEEKGQSNNGYGFRISYSERPSKEFFSYYFINYHDKNFNINDMGYIKKYDNISIGVNFDIEKTPKEKNSLISQTLLEFNIAHDRSDEGGYSGGIDFDVFYELQYKDSSSMKFACYCNFIGGLDFEETRKNSAFPIIENLPGAYMYAYYKSPRTSKIQSVYNIAYGTFGYETQEENLDLRNESFSIKYSNVIKPSDSMQLNIDWFEYETKSNWSIWREDNLFGYYDKEQLSSSLSLDLFRGNNQEFRIKGKIYGIKGQNPRSYRVSSNGYMNSSLDNVNSFQLSETAFQVRYKYEFAPLSNLYIVYTRGGKLTNPFNQEDNFKDIYSDAWTNETLDKFIVKLRLNF